VAVDPTSPITGGALLGDRIRMEERTADRGVFIRSMASRGSRGGLALAAVDACDAMDAFGLDEILVETVGVGQAELDVAAAADTVIVVLCPGAGDGVQAMKAGILEIADLIVVNKADLPGADGLAAQLEDAASARASGRAPSGAPGGERWTAPVITASAGIGRGLEELEAALERHRAHLERLGLERARAAKRAERVRQIASGLLGDALWSDPALVREVERALQERVPPYDVARRIAARVLGGGKAEPRA
jgi:LAO/AO transport system kinase